MEINEKWLAAASCLFAISGIFLMLLLSETPKNADIASALISQENSNLIIFGYAEKISGDKFNLCNKASSEDFKLCISVKGKGIPSSFLVSEGDKIRILGRVKKYMDNRYIEAESIEFTDFQKI